MDSLFALKTVSSDFEVEYELLPVIDAARPLDVYCEDIANETAAIDNRLDSCQKQLDKLNADIDRLSCHADGLDYTIAVISGVVAGLIDIFFVGEWDFRSAKAFSNEEMNRKVMDFAKKNGYAGNQLAGAVSYIEKKFPFPGDNTWSGADIGVSALSHHLDDFKHHPTIVGLLYSIIDQFTATSTYFNSAAEVVKIPLIIDENGLLEGKTPAAKIASGIINWCFNVAKNRRGHLISDMAGSKSTAGAGMGIPGSLLSTLRELAALPGFKDKDFVKKLNQAYTKGIGSSENGQVDLGAFNSLFEGASSKFDMRTEGAIKHELQRQALPVLINEMTVRAFYFIRHFTTELKETGDVSLIEWKKVLPFGNRTISRMMTVAAGVFTMVDMADAAIAAAKKSGGIQSPLFAGQFILHINFVGIGRVAVAMYADVGMGIERIFRHRKRVALCNEQINLISAKVFYKQTDMWITAESTGKTIEKAYTIMERSIVYYIDAINEMHSDLKTISTLSPAIVDHNPDLIEEINDILI